MKRKLTWLAALLAALAASAAPHVALAQSFVPVDTIPWPETGRFPAYDAAPRLPTYYWVQAGLLHDSNIFRLSSGFDASGVLGGKPRSDTVMRLGAGIRHESLIAGRQRVRLEAHGEELYYRNYTQINHFEYGLSGTWLWELTNDLAGTIGYERRQRLVDLAAVQRPIKDLITEDHAFATGAYLVGPSLRLRGGLDYAKARHDDPTLNVRNAEIHTVTVGADYVTTRENAIGIEARRSQGNSPVQEPIGSTNLVDNDFTEREVAIVGTYVPSVQLRATGRLGHTTRRHKEFPQRDFSGNTGRLAVDWVPLNKTGFDFAVYREPRTIVDIASSYVIVNGVSFGPRWAPTEKLVFNAALTRERFAYAGDVTPILLGTPQRAETVRLLRLGAGWEPKRFIQVAGGFEHGIRSSNVLFRDYTYNAVMANIKFAF
jgi:exopolysaccharide biosynthesis operon protein EpsL